MDHQLVFDIETIPQQEPLSEVQKTYLKRRMKKQYYLNELELKKETEAGRGKEFKQDLKRKTMATSAYLGRIVCIGMMHVQEKSFGNSLHFDKFALYGEDEPTLLKEFWDYIAKERFQFISFHGLGFDVPFILRRSMKYGIRPTNEHFLILRKYQHWPHYDTMEVLADWGRAEQISLELACDTFGIQTPKDGEINAKTLEKAYLAGNFKGINEYCLKDVEATYQLFKIIDSYQPKTR